MVELRIHRGATSRLQNVVGDAGCGVIQAEFSMDPAADFAEGRCNRNRRKTEISFKPSNNVSIAMQYVLTYFPFFVMSI